MTNDLDSAIARVANARRMATTAQRVSKAADEARITTLRNLATIEAELQETLNEQIEAHPDAG